MSHGRLALFSPRQVGIATCLPTPLGGLSLIAINYVRIGQVAEAICTLFGGIVLLLILIITSDLAFSWVPGFIQFLVMVIAMHFLAEKLQGKIFIENLSIGGHKSGLLDLWFLSIFIPVSFCICLFGLIFISAR